MFEKLQLRSMSFLRLCLERSGKPVVARECEFSKIAPSAAAPEAPSEEQGHPPNFAPGDRHAHFSPPGEKCAGDAITGTMPVPGASTSAASKKLGNLQSWLEVATTEATKQHSKKSIQAPGASTRASHGGEAQDAAATQRDAARPTTINSDIFSRVSANTRTARATAEPMEILHGLVVASSPRRRAISPSAISPTSEQLLTTLKTTGKKVTVDNIVRSVEPALDSNARLMTSTQWTRGTARVWGGNWGLRDANLTIQHEAYRILESPTGGAGKLGKTAREKSLLQPLPEVKHRGEKAVEHEVRKIFQAYARPSDLFPNASGGLKDAECAPFPSCLRRFHVCADD